MTKSASATPTTWLLVVEYSLADSPAFAELAAGAAQQARHLGNGRAGGDDVVHHDRGAAGVACLEPVGVRRAGVQDSGVPQDRRADRAARHRARAVAAEDWPAGGKALSQIRKLVGINTLIGIATLAVGAGGRWFGMS